MHLPRAETYATVIEHEPHPAYATTPWLVQNKEKNKSLYGTHEGMRRHSRLGGIIATQMAEYRNTVTSSKIQQSPPSSCQTGDCAIMSESWGLPRSIADDNSSPRHSSRCCFARWMFYKSTHCLTVSQTRDAMYTLRSVTVTNQCRSRSTAVEHNPAPALVCSQSH